MKRTHAAGTLVTLLTVLTFATIASAQTRTAWQAHDGLEASGANPLGLVQFGCDPRPIHGNVCEYDDAIVPPAGDPLWGSAPDPDSVDYRIGSRVCGAPVTCWDYGDSTYFQTFVDIPMGLVVTDFIIGIRGVDDGARVSIFNSAHPGGAIVPGSHVFLGGVGATDLSTVVVPGEINRVVITHVDDCCNDSVLSDVSVVVNGEIVARCTSDLECDYGDPCTVDGCNPDGSCRHEFECPDCGTAVATLATIWPPNHRFVEVGVDGVVDPDGHPATITIDSIRQDEPTETWGDGHACADAFGVGGPLAYLRAERSGTPRVPGDGRVYRIAFTATTPLGHECSGVVTVCVPHDRGRRETCLDQGPLHDSISCTGWPSRAMRGGAPTRRARP